MAARLPGMRGIGIRANHPPGMPPSTWLLELSEGRPILYSGSNVEVATDWFFEGVFSGRFSRSGMTGSTFRCGSGAAVFPTGIRVFPPSHPLEPVYCFVLRNEPRVIVSNSFTCALGASELTISPTEFSGLVDLARTMKEGLSSYSRVLLDKEEGVLFRFAFRPFDVTQLRCSPTEILEDHNEAPFSDYTSYIEYLRDTIHDLARNGRSRRRSVPYRKLIATCSSGYDSAAAAALARVAGCSTALTLSTARRGVSDTGVPIAEALGMTSLEFPRFASGIELPIDRDMYVDAASLSPEVARDLMPFLTSPETVEDAVFAPFSEHLPGTILFTGFHGGGVWGLKDRTGPDLNRLDNSGAGLDEIRKRVGFVHVPVPFIGARHVNVIRSISRGPDMAPFRVGGWYDRPIPRRILEESGVARELFGHEKGRGSVLFEKSSVSLLPPKSAPEAEQRLQQSALQVRFEAVTAAAAEYRAILSG